MGEITLIVVILIRLLVPLIIFKKPLLGGLLSIAADSCDVMLFDLFGSGPLNGYYYHNFDKIFDIYYLTIEFVVVLRWKDKLLKNFLKYLYAWRLTGVIIFEVLMLIGIKFRPIFFLAPNIFEYYFLAYLISLKFNRRFKFTKNLAWVYFVIIAIPKFIQEYIMHYAYQDQTWHFFRDNLLFFIYK